MILVDVFNTAPYSKAGPGLSHCAGFCPGVGPPLYLVSAMVLVLAGIVGAWKGENAIGCSDDKKEEYRSKEAEVVEMTTKNPIATVKAETPVQGEEVQITVVEPTVNEIVV